MLIHERWREAARWYVMEYEREGVPPLESLKANFDNFKKLRG